MPYKSFEKIWYNIKLLKYYPHFKIFFQVKTLGTKNNKLNYFVENILVFYPVTSNW